MTDFILKIKYFILLFVHYIFYKVRKFSESQQNSKRSGQRYDPKNFVAGVTEMKIFVAVSIAIITWWHESYNKRTQIKKQLELEELNRQVNS